ncbi:hypothetical protein JQS43_11200 [Natronosporangium hydrolyticum]|uniref:indole-3-glycerol-phosphate synthase n=1 Tax=Natronosporangium hydrolyticum TaxID=2811111 RepID=A0A895YLD2_9ACTN|nr:hypothetical protein [Natronosporangium hydrolyticum]QSB16792.1 hypothetical protein JQS43_11200 [Natronosporangium hydrolyticum]
MTSAFVTAIQRAPRPLVMEVKRRDGHGRDLLAGRSVAAHVRGFDGAAACLSVVTGRWFGGDLELLQEVRRLTDRPLLQKDFITRRDQLRTARDLGASAVLLTAGLLPRSSLGNLVDACLSLGLTPFVEVTTADEVAAIPDPGGCVVAVNNKDIRNRERGPGDPGRSLALLPQLRRAGVDCRVSASGIDQPAVAVGLLQAGFSALLIGTSLLRAERLSDWLAEFDRGWSADQAVLSSG